MKWDEVFKAESFYVVMLHAKNTPTGLPDRPTDRRTRLTGSPPLLISFWPPSYSNVALGRSR